MRRFDATPAGRRRRATPSSPAQHRIKEISYGDSFPAFVAHSRSTTAGVDARIPRGVPVAADLVDRSFVTGAHPVRRSGSTCRVAAGEAARAADVGGDGGLVGRFDAEVDDHRGGHPDDGPVTGVHRVAQGGVRAGGAERAGDGDLPAVGAGRGPGDRVRRAERQVLPKRPAGPVGRDRPGDGGAVRSGHRQVVDDAPGHGDGHGCAGAIPVVPNPGDADTVATGAAVTVTVVGVLLVVASTGDASPDTGGPAAVVTTVDLDDSAPVPQPATAVSTASTAITAITTGPHRNPRPVRCIAVIPGPADDPAGRRRVGGDGVAGDRGPAHRMGAGQLPPGDRHMIRYVTSADHPERDVLLTGPLDPTRGPDALRPRPHQEGEQHVRVIPARPTPPAVSYTHLRA